MAYIEFYVQYFRKSFVMVFNIHTVHCTVYSVQSTVYVQDKIFTILGFFEVENKMM